MTTTGWGFRNRRRGPPSNQPSSNDDPGKDQASYDDPAPQDIAALDVGPEQPTISQQVEALTKCVDVGPWGGDDGFDWDDGKHNGIREIIIHSGQCIDSISVVYDNDGELVAPGRRGGDGGNRAEIKLQYPEEYLVYVSGHYGPFYYWDISSPVLRSLEFRTNKGRKFGPYGVTNAEHCKFFSLPIRNGRIVGFMGRGRILLDGLGFHIVSQD